jgi:type II secretory pathway pseudopilin PulG
MPLYVSIFVVALMTVMGAASLPTLQEQSKQAQSNFEVAQLQAYRQGVNAFVFSNPTVTGEINVASVPMLTGFVDKGKWRNYVDKGVVFIYPSSAAQSQQDFVFDAFQSAHRTPLVGKNVNGQLVGITGLNTGVLVPSAIPNGASVIAGN